MNTPTSEIKKIEQAVERLPKRQLAEFRRWFAKFDADVWDEQIEADAASGKLDALAAEALAEFIARPSTEKRTIH